MTFNLTNVNLNHERIGYFPYTTGIDREGNECMMVIDYDRHASGCNPYYWTASPYNRYGHEFSTREEAEEQIRYAGGSWSVQSFDRNNIKIGVMKFTVVNTATYLGNVDEIG